MHPVVRNLYPENAADRLFRAQDGLMRRFLESIRREFPSVRSEPNSFLADSLPGLITEICNELRDPARQEPYRRVEDVARKHATSRSGLTGYNLVQILSEYHILRRLIIDHLAETGELTNKERVIVNNAIDRGIAHAGQRYFDLWTQEQSARIDRLVEQTAVREQFTHALSHDLRNPLTAIRANLELVARTAGECSDQSRRILQDTIAAADRMNDMITSLLDVGRARAGKPIPISSVPTDLRQLVENTVHELVERFGDRFSVDVPNLIVCCDPLAIRRCLENLVSNAVKYGADRPIQITATEREDSAAICVFNEGDPIPERIRPKLFQPFERAEVKSKHQSGWGVGLFIVKSVVEAHSGSVQVESSRELGGTRVWITLPRKSQRPGDC